MSDAIGTHSRRHFLRNAALVSLGFSGLRFFACAVPRYSMRTSDYRAAGYGALIKDREGILDLPKGFSYRVISRMGQVMDDRLLVPGLPDGMAALPGSDGLTILMRNHELDHDMIALGAFGHDIKRLGMCDSNMFYDKGKKAAPAMGGVTTILFDTNTQSVQGEWLSLGGTVRNCAGGPTPWNSWITCEEDVSRENEEMQEDHGYAFDVPAHSQPQLVKAVPLKDMGRFRREAVAIDPNTGIVYQTEDRPDGLFYRFVPDEPGNLPGGGRVEALAIKGCKSCDTRNWPGSKASEILMGRIYEVEWIQLDDLQSPLDDLRKRGYEAGAARFARAEGAWFGKGECYFACTNGGREQQGQLFRYVPGPYEGSFRDVESPGHLELFLEPNNTRLLQNCDNLTMGPYGDLIVCEDRNDARLVGITPQGKFYTLATSPDINSEYAGATFSPDGSTLFVNIQDAGLTLAITGPWDSRKG